MKRTQTMKKLRSMNIEELKQYLREARADKMKFSASGESVGIYAFPPHTKFLHNVKKEIARVKTVLREKGVKK